MNDTIVNSTLSTTTILTTSTLWAFQVAPNLLARIWSSFYDLATFTIGAVMTCVLFIVCYRQIKEAYVVLILNQLFISFAFCLLQLIPEFFINVLISTETYYDKVVGNPPLWATVLTEISSIGDDMYYPLQLSILLLCANRVVAMYTHNGISRWMNKRLNCVYSLACYLAVLITYFPNAYLTAGFILLNIIITITLCIAFYVKLHRHLKTVENLNDRNRYLQMRQVTNIALIQTIFPIFEYLPIALRTLIAGIIGQQKYYQFLLGSTFAQIFFAEIPGYMYQLNGILISISIILALGDIRNPIVHCSKRMLHKICCKKFVSKVTVIHVKSVVPPTNRINTVNLATRAPIILV